MPFFRGVSLLSVLLDIENFIIALMKGRGIVFYYSKKSNRKIIHLKNCPHIRSCGKTGCFDTLIEAHKNDYHLCKYCNPIAISFRKQFKINMDFCRENGVAFFWSGEVLNFTTPRSQWKVEMSNKGDKLVLYHKNTFEKNEIDLCLNGYHRQYDVQKDSIIEYLKYIVDHDQFRRRNPVCHSIVKPEPPKKGTKRFRREQKKQRDCQKRRAIKDVLMMIESLEG